MKIKYRYFYFLKHRQLDAYIEQEKPHSYTYLTVEMIEKYLRMATFGEVEDISIRKSLVNTYIR